MNALNVLLQPVISERSLNEVAKHRFTFKVSKSADKKDIKKAIEQTYKVNVVNIATVNLKGKGRSIRTRTKVVKVSNKPYKKAVVTLKEGQKISVFESGA